MTVVFCTTYVAFCTSLRMPNFELPHLTLIQVCCLLYRTLSMPSGECSTLSVAYGISAAVFVLALTHRHHLACGGGTNMHTLVFLLSQLPSPKVRERVGKKTYTKLRPPPPQRLFDLQDSLDKRIHFPSQLSDFVPLRNGSYSFRAQTD